MFEYKIGIFNEIIKRIVYSLLEEKDKLGIDDPEEVKGSMHYLVVGDNMVAIYIMKNSKAPSVSDDNLLLIRNQFRKANLNDKYLTVKEHECFYGLIYEIQEGDI